MRLSDFETDTIPMLSAGVDSPVVVVSRPEFERPIHHDRHWDDIDIAHSDSDTIYERQRKGSIPPALFNIAQRVTRKRGKSNPSIPVTVSFEDLMSGRARAATFMVGDRHGRQPQRGCLRAQQSMPEPRGRPRRKSRHVTFKAVLCPDVAPSKDLQSYDELFFNVAGLYQTTSYLHEPFGGEDPNACSSSTTSSSLPEEEEPPLERSVPLMIAEFLYRSAVYLGYPPGEEKPWLPGFREHKRFSVNDVKRWRRLAHYDWEREEQEFLLRQHGARAAELFPTISHASSSTSNHSSNSTESTTSSSSSKRRFTSGGLRSAVSQWLQQRRHRRHSAPAKIVSMENPPPLPATIDLTWVVTIANSCVYCGTFQFTERDIRTLCNVDIDVFINDKC